ncbi:NAD(P)/FAD-dependent oxidoreductase [Patescibacteria group bacterium]
MTTDYDFIIIGSGAAGLAAGVYGGRYGMKTLIIGKEFGGETMKAGLIENWPGDKEVDGFDLIMRMKDHAISSGSEVIDGEVTNVDKNGDIFSVFVGDKEYKAPNVLFALGSRRRRLGLPNEDELTSKGVHYCTTCDSPIYSGKTIALVGGGDASIKGAVLAAQYVDKIYMIVRKDVMRAEPINQEKLKALGDKVEILFETEVTEIIGEDKLEKIVLSKEFNGSKEMVVDGLFIEIGAVPDTAIAEELGVEIDAQKHINVDNMMRTNIPGIYAAGDSVNHFGHFKQIITAAALGSVAATSAFEHYKELQHKA